MQSLLWDRLTSKISAQELITTVAESFYSTLSQRALYNVFPKNCHRNAAVNSLALESNDYQYLLSGCADSSIKLWDMGQVDRVPQPQPDNLDDNQLDDDEQRTTEPMSAWTDTRKYGQEDFDNPQQVFHCLATIPRKTVHQYGVSSVNWWPFDTGMFLSSSFDHTVKIWDTNELSPVHTFDMNNRVYSIDVTGSQQNQVSASAITAVASDQPFIRLLDIRAASSAHTLSGHKGKTLAVKWHPQNPHLLSSGGYDGEVKIWDIRRSRNCLCRLDMLKTDSVNKEVDSTNLTKPSVKAHSGPVNGLVWDELGVQLFTAGNDDKVRCWDVTSSCAPPVNRLINFGPLTRNKYPQTIPLVLNPRKETELQYLFFPSDNDDVFVYRTIDGKLVTRLTRQGSKNQGRTSAMCNAGPYTGTYICGTMDGEIIVWYPSTPVPHGPMIKSSHLSLSGEEVTNKARLAQEARDIVANDPYLRKNMDLTGK